MLRRDESFTSRLYLSLLLGTTFADRPGAENELRKILSSLAEEVRVLGNGQEFYKFFTEVLPEPETYNGNLSEWLRYLSVATDGRIGLLRRPLLVPCELLIKHKALRNVSMAEMGSSMDNYFPQTDCHKFQEKLPQSFFEYSKFIKGFGGAYGEENMGSIRHYYGRMDTFRLDRIAVFPEELGPPPEMVSEMRDGGEDSFCNIPLAKWSLVGPSNWVKHQALVSLFNTALDDLAAYYETYLEKDTEVARFFAQSALEAEGSPAEGHWKGMKCPIESLRYAILSNVPTGEIFDGLAEGRYDSNEWADGYPGYKDYYYKPGIDSYPGQPEPILHVAVFRPDILKRLIETGLPVDAPNRFGKTPLMTAAQYDQLEAVKILLEAGANVNAATQDTMLVFRKRTALMYAATNASLPVIRALIKAGADLRAMDSLSHTAREYLEGVDAKLRGFVYGSEQDYTVSVPANYKLMEPELQVARELLTPN